MNISSTGDCCQFQHTTLDTDKDKDGYNPLDNGFKVTSVSLNEINKLDVIDSNGHFQFQYPWFYADADVMLHTPQCRSQNLILQEANSTFLGDSKIDIL